MAMKKLRLFMVVDEANAPVRVGRKVYFTTKWEAKHAKAKVAAACENLRKYRVTFGPDHRRSA